MKVLGIITEYNPFHNGHIKHIKESKLITNADYIIAVMSGNYVERGEPAICDKYFRTEAALKNGVDIVIELPLLFASNSAEYFAGAAIELLNKTGVVDTICFGSEKADINALYDIAGVLIDETPSFKEAIKYETSRGLPYPKARYNALKKIIKYDIDFLYGPNNILAVEYIKALIRTGSKIKPYTIDRSQTPYHKKELDDTDTASATAIRRALITKNFDAVENVMPYAKELKNLILNNEFGFINKFSDFFHYIILNTNPKDLSNFLNVDEGLENRIIKYAKEFFYLTDIAANIKTKRYTYTKIQRMLMHIILNIKKDDFKLCQISGPQYIRVLGFKYDSRNLLSEIIKKASLPVFTNLKDADALTPTGQYMLDKELYSSDLYYLASRKTSVKNIEFKKPVVILRE